MKYSIIVEPVANQLPLDQKAIFQKVFSDYNASTSIVVSQDRILKLRSRRKAQQMEGSEQSYMQVVLKENLNWKGLKMIWNSSDQWVLVFQRPFQLYFVVNKYRKILPIKLNQGIDLIEMSCYVSYPDLLIYGHQEKSYSNKLYSINLTTFETKEITSNKEYSPKGRKGFWSLFSDSRLYVAGGHNQKEEQIDELMWTLNIENGYWFALEFKKGNSDICETSLNCEFENGKVLVAGKNGLSVVELYQSQAKEVQGWKEVFSLEVLSQATNLLLWDEWFYLVVNNSVFPKRFKINKSKSST